MSSFTQASKVLSGLPRPLFPGNAMSMTEDSSFERLTCPNPLRRRVRSSTIASTKCNLASKSSDGMPSLALTPQIQRNIALSCCRSETFGAQVSPPLSIVGHTREFYTLNYTFNCPILLTLSFSEYFMCYLFSIIECIPFTIFWLIVFITSFAKEVEFFVIEGIHELLLLLMIQHVLFSEFSLPIIKNSVVNTEYTLCWSLYSV